MLSLARARLNELTFTSPPGLVQCTKTVFRLVFGSVNFLRMTTASPELNMAEMAQNHMKYHLALLKGRKDPMDWHCAIKNGDSPQSNYETAFWKWWRNSKKPKFPVFPRRNLVLCGVITPMSNGHKSCTNRFPTPCTFRFYHFLENLLCCSQEKWPLVSSDLQSLVLTPADLRWQRIDFLFCFHSFAVPLFHCEILSVHSFSSSNISCVFLSQNWRRFNCPNNKTFNLGSSPFSIFSGSIMDVHGV